MKPIIDDEEVKELKEFVKHRFQDIAETYLRCSDEYVENILKGFKDEDAVAIVDSAHPLKSSSGNLGLRALSELALNIEETGSEVADGARNLTDLAPMIEQLKDVHQKSAEALREHI